MLIPEPLQKKKCVSYGGFEKERFDEMERVLMEHYCYNYSQLHKVLIREKYYALKTAI